MPKRKLASKKQLLLLGARWDKIGKCRLVRACEIDERDVANVFPVIKSVKPFPQDGVDRQIFDRRRRNARERRVVTGSRLHVPAHHAIRFSDDDLRNVYHAIPGTWERACSTPVGNPYHHRILSGWRCARDDVGPEEMMYLAWSGLRMGDHNAVDWAEELHLNLLQSDGLLLLQHILNASRRSWKGTMNGL